MNTKPGKPRYRHKRKPVRPVDPRCSAPGCPLRYYHVLNNGDAYCRFHHGVQGADRVHAVTKRLHEMMPVIRQIKTLSSLNASQRIGFEPVPVDGHLPVTCRRREVETLDAWRDRLRALLEDEIGRAKRSGVVNG